MKLFPSDPRKRDCPKKLCVTAAAAGTVLSGYAAAENTFMLRTVSYETDYPELPRTVLISDLHRRHFGTGQCRLLRKITDLQPELILIAGDLISRNVKDLGETALLLRKLRAIAPVIYAEGNHETDLPPSLYHALCRIVPESGALFLRNSYTHFKGIPIAGLSLPPAYYRGGKRFGYCGKYRCTKQTMLELLGKCPENTLLLAHNPLFFPAYAEWGAKLVLSGHMHGGSVRLPGIGGLLSPERCFFPRYDKGCFRQGDTEMIVSGGLGKLRLFNPPEICLLTAGNSKK